LTCASLSRPGTCTPCSSCPSGYFKAGCSGTSAGACSVCPSCNAGEENAACAGVSPGSCTPCSAGMFAAPGSTRCHVCPAGSIAPSGSSGGPEMCECDAGYALGQDATCTACAAGKLKDTIGSQACDDCGAGKFSLGGASSACDDCGAGKFSLGGASSCTKCAAGKYSSAVRATVEIACIDCAAGKYQDQLGASSCVSCPSFSYHVVAGATARAACVCDAGYTGPDGGACTPCAAGSYKASRGSQSCATCPPNSTTAPGMMGASSLDACVCGGGHTGEGHACRACAAAKYKDVTGSAACFPCPAGYYSSAASTASSDCYPAPVVVFALAVDGDIAASQVTDNITSQLLDSIALALKVDASLVRIMSITDARRRLLAIAVDVQVTVIDDTRAASLAAKGNDVATAVQVSANNAGFLVTVVAAASVVPPPVAPPVPPLSWPSLPTPAASPPPLAANEDAPAPSSASEDAPAAPEEHAIDRADGQGGANLGLVVGLAASGAGVLIIVGYSLYLCQRKKQRAVQDVRKTTRRSGDAARAHLTFADEENGAVVVVGRDELGVR